MTIPPPPPPGVFLICFFLLNYIHKRLKLFQKFIGINDYTMSTSQNQKDSLEQKILSAKVGIFLFLLHFSFISICAILQFLVG